MTGVSQVGTDRIIEFQFSDGQYRLYLEFYAAGNIILTDKDLNILALLRIVPPGEGQEELRIGLQYSLENRQNYNGVPDLTKERVREALQKAADKGDAPAKGKKSNDAIRRALAVSIPEYPPLVLDHSMRLTGFDATLKPADVLENDSLIDKLIQVLEQARKVVEEVTSSDIAKGYIISKPSRSAAATTEEENEDGPARKSLPPGYIYDDFHPFLPLQFEDEPAVHVTEIEGYNKTVDEFYSSIELQRLETRLQERELAAKKKLEAAKQDQAKRLGGLQEIQELNVRKANAIEANLDRVQEAMDAVNALIASGKDWVEIEKLIEFEQKRHNAVADLIKLPLHLEKNTITVLLSEEAFVDDSDDQSDATDSDASDSEDESTKPQNGKKTEDKRLAIDIDLAISPYGNAREHYDHKRSAAAKQAKTAEALTKALKSQEAKISHELKKGLKQEKPMLRPTRQQIWFEKFVWFISSDGYLVLAGRDAQQSEILYKKYLRKGDVFVHADIPAAFPTIIRNNLSSSSVDAPIPPSTLTQAGTLCVCTSTAWDSKAGMSAWWVGAEQVGKTATTGEILPVGRFEVKGKKNFLPPSQLVLGFGVLFRVSEESVGRHVKNRVYDEPKAVGAAEGDIPADALVEGSHEEEDDDEEDGLEAEKEHPEHEKPAVAESGEEDGHVSEEGEDEDTEAADSQSNPLDSSAYDKEHENGLSTSAHDSDADVDEPPSTAMEDLHLDDAPAEGDDDNHHTDDSAADSTGPNTGTSTPQTQAGKSKNAAPLPRGKRTKAKKIAKKYRDQDDEDRLFAQSLIGSTLGQQKAAEEAKLKAQKEAEAAFHRERRKAQHQKSQKDMAEHEEKRRQMLESGGLADEEEEETGQQNINLDSFVGAPLQGDVILDALPICAPWPALAKNKYKIKLQPGTTKKGKAVKEIIERLVSASDKKGVVDAESRDGEKMWPREVELLKGWRAEECVGVVPVGKVRVVMSGGAVGSGGGGKGKGGGLTGKAQRGQKKRK